jgi:hypothetical protein
VTVGTADDDGVFTIQFASQGGLRSRSRDRTIDYQHSLPSGLDTHALSNEDGATVYGGVESAKLGGTSLELRVGERPWSFAWTPSPRLRLLC